VGLTKTGREPPSSPPSFVKTAATVSIPVNSAKNRKASLMIALSGIRSCSNTITGGGEPW
jgi:hypothetical protein